MAPSDITQLGTYGLTGVMLALIMLTASAIWILYKIVANHISHSANTQEKLSGAITELTTTIKAKL